MSTVVSPPLSASNPRARLVIAANMEDYVDFANKRLKSGIVLVTLNTLTWTGSGLVNTEKMHVRAAAPDYNAETMRLFESDFAMNAGSAGSGFVNSQPVPINYGRPGPGAKVESDGTILFSAVDIQLPPGTAATNVVATLTYAADFVPVDPYSQITGSDIHMKLNVGPNKAAAWGQIARTDPLQYYVLQFQNLKSNVYSPTRGPRFSFRPGGPNMNLPTVQYEVPQGVSRVKTFKDAYTWVFGVNQAGLVDQNGTNIAGENSSFANLLGTVSLEAPDFTDDVADIDLTYRIQSLEI